MFNFTFSFAAALWALPLAGAPILLHLLFKQKSPVVQFSTLRFIKLSIQRTAARKRVQKWLLLAIRALLIALLIWAIAQPAAKITSAWMGGGQKITAVIVVDTSYSMQLQDGQVTLLSKADAMVQDLLRNQLAGAKVAIFRSMPAGDPPEKFEDSSGILAEWTPLKPQPSPKKLRDRVAAAVDLLDKQPADQKWLVVISDFQTREFSQAIPAPKNARTVLLDLHLKEARSAGIGGITIFPQQPIPGIAAQATVAVNGREGDARPWDLTLDIETLNHEKVSSSNIHTINLDSKGRGTDQFPLLLPAERWLLLTASLTDNEIAPWEKSRTQLLEVPPKQHVAVLQQSVGSSAERLLRLALDPSEGLMSQWPIAVTKAGAPTTNEDTIVLNMAHWPDAGLAARLRKYAGAGHTVIFFLAPGLERTWPNLQQAEQNDLAALLPSPPIQRPGTSVSRATVVDDKDPLLEGLVDDKFQIGAIVVRQLVPLAAQGRATTILNAAPVDPTPGSRTQGLLFRNPVDKGVCYTFSTTPDSQFTNLGTHPIFLPLLVRMALKPLAQGAGQNVEMGNDLVLDGASFSGVDTLDVTSPAGERSEVRVTRDDSGRRFVFDSSKAGEPGLYLWQKKNDPVPLAITNVQYPASETELTYRQPGEVAPAGGDTVIAASMPELAGKMKDLSVPRQQWSTPLAIVMFLLCLEALMGSWSKMWKPAGLRAFMPAMKNEAVG